jgi:hypothetical protein
MGTDNHGNLQRISLLSCGLHVAPEMASASHVERVPVLADDLHPSKTHIDRFRGERISCNRKSRGDVSPQAGLGAVTGVVLYNGKAVQVDIIPLENSFLDWRTLIEYSVFAL